MKKTHAVLLFLVFVAIPVIVWQFWLKAPDSKIPGDVRAKAINCLESLNDTEVSADPIELIPTTIACAKAMNKAECNWTPEDMDTPRLSECRNRLCADLRASDSNCTQQTWGSEDELEFAAAIIQSALGVAPSPKSKEKVNSVLHQDLTQMGPFFLNTTGKALRSPPLSDTEIADGLMIPFILVLLVTKPPKIKVRPTASEPVESPKEIPRIAVNPRPGAVILTVNFSSYCSPKPELVYRVEERNIFVKATVPDGPLSRCVELYRSAINVDGLEAGSYTVVWEGSGDITPIPIEIP